MWIPWNILEVLIGEQTIGLRIIPVGTLCTVPYASEVISTLDIFSYFFQDSYSITISSLKWPHGSHTLDYVGS
jgi:hypothetical protein